MSVAWDLYDTARERGLKYASWFGCGKGTIRLALADLKSGDIDNAIAVLQKYLDNAESAFPPSKTETLS
jgi:hypothetical protein